MQQTSFAPLLFPSPPIPPVFPNTPCVVRIDPRGRTRWKGEVRHAGMVGKVLWHAPRNGYVFYSRHKGSKRHRDSGSDFPMDDLLVTWLLQGSIFWVYHYNERTKTLYRQETAVLAEAPLEVMDGMRVRLLPDGAWETLRGVVQLVQGNRRFLTNEAGEDLYLVEPYIRQPDLTLRPPGGF